MATSFTKTLDEALKALIFLKFKSFLSLSVQNTGIVFEPKSITQRKIAEKRGVVNMEFMSFWRQPPQFDWKRSRTPVSRSGMLLEYANADRKGIITAKSVPATINYDVYFWTQSLDKLMQITEEYLFWMFDNPQLNIYFNDKYLMEIDLDIGSITDESPLDQVYEKGTYFVYKMPIKMQGWIVVLSTTKTILDIIMRVYYNDNLETATSSNSVLLAEYNITESDES